MSYLAMSPADIHQLATDNFNRISSRVFRNHDAQRRLAGFYIAIAQAYFLDALTYGVELGGVNRHHRKLALRQWRFVLRLKQRQNGRCRSSSALRRSRSDIALPRFYTEHAG